MPWCDSCSEYRTPNTVTTDSLCPDCGTPVETESEVQRTVGQSAPWHFWVVVVLLAAYLLWRLLQAIAWLV